MTSPLRIAVADDEPELREYFQKILPRLGHEVIGVAENGQELLNLCRGNKPDLIISDIHMPGMGGLEATRTLYKETAIPIILISALNDPEILDRAENDHVMCFIVKPIKQTDLLPAIALAMQKFSEGHPKKEKCEDLRSQRGSLHPCCIPEATG